MASTTHFHPIPKHFWISTSPNDSRKVALLLCPPTVPQHCILAQTTALVNSLFSNTKAKPSRFIYALAGYLFDPRAPVPFGGSKSNPGYLAFCGSSTEQLLQFILVEAYHTYWKTHSSKALKLVCSAGNKVLDLHHKGMKDEMDEYLLKGMKKSGHCEWFGAVRVPFTLRHVDEGGGGGVSPWSVEFSMPRLDTKDELEEEEGGGL
ncbi:hypothetical protein HDU98_007122 [Podochytrium sp. JEL0797]|nr:hypothetical protein HDU98_007122 [Podochytrium sp. JEL0797]